MKEICFVTHNPGKVASAQKYFPKINLICLNVDLYEPRSSKGTIATEPIGGEQTEQWSSLWGIFIPKGCTKTLAQMNQEERFLRKDVDGSTSAIEVFSKWLEG